MALAGRVVLVTGASSGIGAHCAKLFAAQGARVVMGARRVDRLAALAAQLGKSALAVPLDVTNEASLVAAYDAAEANFGVVDTVLANAGVARGGRSVDVPMRHIETEIATNLTGVYLTAREGAKRMIAAGIGKRDERGRIVLVGSLTANQTTPGIAAYAATKAAVAHLGRQFAREWARSGINVNTIEPGYIHTEVAGDWWQTPGGAKQLDSFLRKRLCPIEALDGPLVFLTSDAGRYVTGATLIVDDGQSLG